MTGGVICFAAFNLALHLALASNGGGGGGMTGGERGLEVSVETRTFMLVLK